MNQTASEVKYAHRIAPCPAYDVAGTEQWLTDMAARGLHLSPDGFALGIVSFERGEPRQMRYRLDAIPRRGFFDEGDAPDGEAVELAAEYGWEYVGRRGEFYIYRAEGEDARELNTDPRVQALAMRAVRARQRWALLDILFWLLLYPLARNGGLLYRTPLLTSLTLGTWLTLFSMAMVTWYCARAVIHAIALERLYRRLSRGEMSVARGNDPHRARRHRALTVIRIVLTVVWIVLLAVRTLNLTVDKGEIGLAAYLDGGGEIPFATVTELVETQGEVSDSRHTMNAFGNTVRVWRDPIAPVNFDYCEITEVTLADGRVIEGGLYVEYHEAANARIAAALAREHLRFDRRRGKRYDPLSVELSASVDQIYAYLDNLHMPTVIIQVGERVIRASFHRYSESTEIPIEVWAQAVAQSICQSGTGGLS